MSLTATHGCQHSIVDYFAFRSNCTVLEKIATIAIPLLAGIGCVWMWMSYRAPKDKSTVPPPYSNVCEQARKFAEQEIESKKEKIEEGLKKYVCESPTRVWHLVELLNESFADEFAQILFGNKETILQNEASTKRLDAYMKQYYALTTLILEDIHSRFEKEHKDDQQLSDFVSSEICNRFELLSGHFVNLYHLVRGGYMRLNRAESGELHPLTEELIAFFYTPGKAPCEWREMYNDICDRIEFYVPSTARSEKCKKLVLFECSSKDVDRETFTPLLPGAD